MADRARGTIEEILRYPMKAFSPQKLGRVSLEPEKTIAFDRAYAIENGPGRFDPDVPRHLPKVSFLTLMRDERLATLETKFDDATEMLTILRGGKQVARGQLSTKLGRSMIEQFIAAYLNAELRGAPRIVSAAGHSFSDVAAKCVHVINLASLRDLERAAGRKIDPIRFRPNIIVDGIPAWSEFEWVGTEFGLGSARVQGFDRTQRCAATNVDPGTGARDMGIPAILQRTWGHADFGIYATVVAAGEAAAGDSVG
ncbi:MAG: MOSC domain-containing protein [Hyphomicrobium sp.]|nr:MOSC domain-containing protein [Hyphomicrobium sp.]PPC82883.1 MAG: MOSC domain-containing protein [Hyphomicrobium sp.]